MAVGGSGVFVGGIAVGVGEMVGSGVTEARAGARLGMGEAVGAGVGVGGSPPQAAANRIKMIPAANAHRCWRMTLPSVPVVPVDPRRL